MTKKEIDGIVDSIPRRLDFELTAASAATTAVQDEEATGLSLAANQLLYIPYWTVQPRDLVVPPDGHVGVRFQLQDREAPTDAAEVDVGSVDDLGTLDIWWSLDDNGQAIMSWPATRSGPWVTAKPKLTAMMDASADIAPFNSAKVFIMCVYYFVFEGTAELLARMAMARGLS